MLTFRKEEKSLIDHLTRRGAESQTFSKPRKEIIRIKSEINETENRKTIQKKINETKTWFFEKNNKIDNIIARLQRKRDRRQKLLISRTRQYITTKPADIKRIVWEYCKQLCTHKFDNLCKIDQFLKICKLPEHT